VHKACELIINLSLWPSVLHTKTQLKRTRIVIDTDIIKVYSCSCDCDCKRLKSPRRSIYCMNNICGWIMNCVNCGHCVCSHRAKKLVASAAKCPRRNQKDEKALPAGFLGTGSWKAAGWNVAGVDVLLGVPADTHNFTAGAYRRQNLNHCVASSAFCYNLRFMGDILQFTLSQKHFATVCECVCMRLKAKWAI